MKLDEAIRTTATELGLRKQFTTQTKIAVLNFSSNWRDLSAYVIDEINNAIVRDGSLTVVNRQQLELVRREQNFQMSGEVDDKSAQSIGKFLGAQSVLSGSFAVIGNIYRFRIKVISVETGIEQYSNSIDIKKDKILTALIKEKRKPGKIKKPAIFDDYTFFNGLTLFGYTYSPDKPLGFSLGAFGVYASLGFALPNWGNYEKTNSSYSHTGTWGTPDYNSTPYTDQRHQIINWALGYNVTIIPNTLYLPIGVGTEAVREWRLQDLSGGSRSDRFEWNPAPEWETSFLFEAGLLFRVKTPINFAPYLFGTYRNIGINKHTFSVGGGGSFDFLGNK